MQISEPRRKDVTFKIISAGDGGVGKTTMLYRFVENRFTVDTKMTIGVGFFQKNVDLGDGNIYSLQLWDLGGEAHFRPFQDKYVLGVDGAFLMFDLTRLVTLKSIDKWVNLIRKEDPNCPIILIGSKLDLKDKISVTDEVPLGLKEKYNFIDYLKVSSKTGYNVNDVFTLLTGKILKYKKF